MTANEYQEAAASFGQYANQIYIPLMIAEEAGELVGKVAKHIRANGLLNWDASDACHAEALKKECGDILWGLAELCTIFGWKLEDVMQENIAKLKDRQARGVIVGSGDDR